MKPYKMYTPHFHVMADWDGKLATYSTAVYSFSDPLSLSIRFYLRAEKYSCWVTLKPKQARS